MNIIFIRSNPVMPDSRVEKEVNSLLKNGHNVKILAWSREKRKRFINEGVKDLQNGFVKIIWFNIKGSFGGGIKKNLISLIRFQFYIFIWLIKNRNCYDIIHACDFDTVLPAFICKKIFKKKYIYDIFDYYVDAYNVPKKIKKIVEYIDIKMINNANALIITNESRKEQIRKSKPKNLRVIHNSPDINLKLNKNIKFILDDKKIKFVYVGILSENRFLEEVIDIFSKHNEWELHIGGFGQLEKKFKVASENFDNIKFYGRLEYNDTLRLEKECDIMFAIYNPNVANHKYSSPNKLYEAMMFGKPIIVSEDMGIDTFVKKNNFGKVISYNRESFIDKANELISEKNTWDGISNNMKKKFINEYSWGIMEKKLVELYDKI